jgi:uncharacterized LabA/DUF88 family protein
MQRENLLMSDWLWQQNKNFSSYLIKEETVADIISKKKDLTKNTQTSLEQSSSFTKTSVQHQADAAPTSIGTNVPSQGDRGRVIIFIDGANLFYAASSLKIKIDYAKFINYLMAKDFLVRALFYTGCDPTNKKQKGFLDWMSYRGFCVITKEVAQAPNGFKRANLDVEIAVDMMRLAQHCDTAVLVSGDGDFVSVVNMIARQGVRVEVVGLRSMTSSVLIDMADCYTDLAAIQNTVKSSSP